ncbi:hypothetical protein GCM10027446_10730 [Angustibacter peucedani]
MRTESKLVLAGRRAVVLLVGCAVLGLVGNAVYEFYHHETHPDTAVRTVKGTHVLMETEAYEGDVGGVGVGGTLAVLPSGCVGFHEPSPVLLLFASGTEVGTEDGRLAIHVAGDQFTPPTVLHVGDPVDGGARTGQRKPLSSYGSDLERATPAACRKYPVLPVDGLRVR